MRSPDACLRHSFSPLSCINQAALSHIQHGMIECLKQWGLPLNIKVDNGKPFGDPQRSSIPELCLWLSALGVQTIWNRPRQPRDNARVERMQGTTSRWVEVARCNTHEELQHKLDHAAVLQREHYRVKRLGYQSRKERYAQLWNNARRYDEHQSFEQCKVEQYLSQVVFSRKVNSAGVFNFYAQTVYIAKGSRQEVVTLQYSVDEKHFIIRGRSGQRVGVLQADNFSAENIRQLTCCQHRYCKVI